MNEVKRKRDDSKGVKGMKPFHGFISLTFSSVGYYLCGILFSEKKKPGVLTVFTYEKPAIHKSVFKVSSSYLRTAFMRFPSNEIKHSLCVVKRQ